MAGKYLWRNEELQCEPTNSIELVLGGLLQSYAWILARLARCQGVSRGKREKSRIDNLGKTHHDHIFLIPHSNNLSLPQAASLVQESWGRWQDHHRQRRLAHSLPQCRGEEGRGGGGAETLLFATRWKTGHWQWSAVSRLLSAAGCSEVNRLWGGGHLDRWHPALQITICLMAKLELV